MGTRPDAKLGILAIDPGEMTGISYSEDNVFMWGSVVNWKTFQSTNFLTSIVKISNPDFVIIEVPPTSGKFYNHQQYGIFESAKNWFKIAGFNVVPINPGQWKNLVPRSKVDATHIRDAADMATWFYSMHQNRASDDNS